MNIQKLSKNTFSQVIFIVLFAAVRGTDGGKQFFSPLNHHKRDFIFSFAIVTCSDSKGRLCIINGQESAVRSSYYQSILKTVEPLVEVVLNDG